MLRKLFSLIERFFVKPPEVPDAPDTTVKVEETIIVTGDYNLHGKLYKWAGKKYKEQGEGQDPIFEVRAGGKVYNGQIEGAPDGVHLIGKGAAIRNVVFRDVCEDAVTILAPNCTIEDCFFPEAKDKCIQHNKGDNAKIRGCTFVNVAKAYRLPDHPGEKIHSLFENNKIYLRGQVYAESNLVTVDIRGNRWYGVKNPISEGNASFHLSDNKGA